MGLGWQFWGQGDIQTFAGEPAVERRYEGGMRLETELTAMHPYLGWSNGATSVWTKSAAQILEKVDRARKALATFAA